MLKQNQVNIFARSISLEGSQMKNEDPLIIPIAAPAYEALKEAMNLKTAVALVLPQRTHRKSETWKRNVIHPHGESRFKPNVLIFLCDLCVLCDQMLFLGS